MQRCARKQHAPRRVNAFTAPLPSAISAGEVSVTCDHGRQKCRPRMNAFTRLQKASAAQSRARRHHRERARLTHRVSTRALTTTSANDDSRQTPPKIMSLQNSSARPSRHAILNMPRERVHGSASSHHLDAEKTARAICACVRRNASRERVHTQMGRGRPLGEKAPDLAANARQATQVALECTVQCARKGRARGKG